MSKKTEEAAILRLTGMDRQAGCNNDGRNAVFCKKKWFPVKNKVVQMSMQG
jgi:hypothetical protein